MLMIILYPESDPNILEDFLLSSFLPLEIICLLTLNNLSCLNTEFVSFNNQLEIAYEHHFLRLYVKVIYNVYSDIINGTYFLTNI